MSSLYSSNRFFFDDTFASDPALDFTVWSNRRIAKHLEMGVYWAAPDSSKQLILIFAFDTFTGGLVQVYSDAEHISDQVLQAGDNQFAIEIASPPQALDLLFVHAGGDWFFKGISGYLV